MEYDKGLIWEAFWKKKEQRAEKPNGLGCWWEVCGKSRGYWVEIVRDRRSGRREVEAQQTTKFEKHWVVVGAPKRPNGRSYTTRQSPYDPEPGYAGLWKGWTAPPRRIGPSAPRRWPAESDEPEKTVEISISANRWRSKWRPYGPRPYELKWDQTIASRTITDRLRLSNARHNYQRLRDQKAHILERRRRSGSLFRDKDGPTPAQFARGVRWAELEGIELYRRHDQLRWFVDRPITNRELADEFRSKNRHGRQVAIPHGADSEIAARAGFEFQELQTTQTRRRRKYGRRLRERRKPGRKPLGDHAMTNAERVRKHRAKHKDKTPATHRRNRPGAV